MAPLFFLLRNHLSVSTSDFIEVFPSLWYTKESFENSPCIFPNFFFFFFFFFVVKTPYNYKGSPSAFSTATIFLPLFSLSFSFPDCKTIPACSTKSKRASLT